MEYKFKYTQTSSDGILRPTILAELSNNSNPPIALTMLLDSGADISMIPENIGTALGLQKTGKKLRVSGIGGSLSYYKTDISVKVGNIKLTIPCAWVEDNDVPIILGRQKFFEKFVINFNEAKKEVTLVEN